LSASSRGIALGPAAHRGLPSQIASVAAITRSPIGRTTDHVDRFGDHVWLLSVITMPRFGDHDRACPVPVEERSPRRGCLARDAVHRVGRVLEPAVVHRD
jgi:hypothetical protein